MIFRLMLIFGLLFSIKYNSFIDASKSEKISDKVKITGHWEGTLTHDEGGGKRTIYSIQLDLLQRKNEVTGTSYMNHEVDEKTYYAKFEAQGKMNGNYFKFIESKIINADSIPQASWCIKKAELMYRKTQNIETLEGISEGASSLGDCKPGRIFLQRKPPRV
jgi:hypothetical protein